MAMGKGANSDKHDDVSYDSDESDFYGIFTPLPCLKQSNVDTHDR